LARHLPKISDINASVERVGAGALETANKQLRNLASVAAVTWIFDLVVSDEFWLVTSNN